MDLVLRGGRYVYMAGQSTSTDFPTTEGAFQVEYGGSRDIVVTQLDFETNELVYSTYLGGNEADYAHGLAVDATGAAYLIGDVTGEGFPTTAGALLEEYPGGEWTALIAKLEPSGADLVYATYLGGSMEDLGEDIAVDSAGNAYATGWTMSADFPVTPGAFQTVQPSPYNYSGFVAKLNPSGTDLVYGTYLGGTRWDVGESIALDSTTNAYVFGWTLSSDFPLTPDALQAWGGNYDVFLSQLSASGAELLYSTYIGGSGDEYASSVAIDPAGNIYATGRSEYYTVPFPTTEGAFQETPTGGADSFIVKFWGKPPKADIRVTVSADPSHAVLNEELIYTVLIENAGPDAAEDVELVDEVAKGLKLVSVSPECSVVKSTVNCELGMLSPGGEVEVVIVTTVSRPGRLMNTASVSSDTPDPEPSNNTDTLFTSVVRH